MATKKVKKFGSGGDIVTGLGAVLLGKALYDEYNKPKSKDASTTDSPVKKQTPDVKVSPPYKDPDPDPVVVNKVNKDEAREAAQKRAENQSKNPRLNLVPEGLSDKDINTLYESDKALVRTDGGGGGGGGGGGSRGARIPPKSQVVPKLKPGESRVTGEGTLKPYPNKSKPNEERPSKPYPSEQADATKRALNENKTAADKAAADKRLKPSDVSGVGFGATSLTNIARSEAAAREKAARDRLKKFEEKRRESKERDARRTQAQNKAKSGTSLRAPGSSMNLNDPYNMMLGSDLDPKRMVRENRSRIPGDKTEYKKGGAVKKMASGGSVKSASARADGCAIRGKTRA